MHQRPSTVRIKKILSAYGAQQRLYIHFPVTGARMRLGTRDPRRQHSFQSFEKRKTVIVRKMLLRTIRNELDIRD